MPTRVTTPGLIPIILCLAILILVSHLGRKIPLETAPVCSYGGNSGGAVPEDAESHQLVIPAASWVPGMTTTARCCSVTSEDIVFSGDDHGHLAPVTPSSVGDACRACSPSDGTVFSR